MKLEIIPGDVVLCLDNTDVSDILEEGTLYQVSKVSHCGFTLNLVDLIDLPFAVTRFQLIKFDGGHWPEVALKQRKIFNECNL